MGLSHNCSLHNLVCYFEWIALLESLHILNLCNVMVLAASYWIFDNKHIVLSVGASGDPSGITMVDSIKVFVKTKEAFGWPDEPQEDLIGGFPALATSTVETPNVSGEITLKMPTTNTDQ